MGNNESTSHPSADADVLLAEFQLLITSGVFDFTVDQTLSARHRAGDVALIEKVASRNSNPVTIVARQADAVDTRLAMSMVGEYAFHYSGRGIAETVQLFGFSRAGLLDEELFLEAWQWGLDARNAQAGKGSPIVEAARLLNLHPTPAGGTKGNWTALCPGMGPLPPHRLMLSANSGEFGCGYCRRKGGTEELEMWARERWPVLD